MSSVVNASVLLVTVFIGPLLAVAVPQAAVDLALAEARTEQSRVQSISSGDFLILRRDDDHMHMHHSAPLTELNETAILQWHAPTPPSYWSIDIEDDPSVPRYPGLMILHVAFMSFAFFVALPIGKELISSVCAFGLTLNGLYCRHSHARSNSYMAWIHRSRILQLMCTWVCFWCIVH